MIFKAFVSEIHQPGLDNFIETVTTSFQMGQTSALVMAHSCVTESYIGFSWAV